MGSEATIVLTYDPRWRYTPEDHTPFWASLDTVDYVAALLEETENTVLLVQTDSSVESRFQEIMREQASPLVFWLNEFMPTESGRDAFTVRIIEKLGMMHTGPGSRALAMGLDKEATKALFRRLGLPTPESYVVYPGDCSAVGQAHPWSGFSIIKPLLQGNSRGLDEFCVVAADDNQAIRRRVDQVHREFDEPALVERYIGGENEREFTVPMLISHVGGTAELPITEIDLSRIPMAQGRFRFLTNDIKDEKYYLKIPADLPARTMVELYSDVRRIIKQMGCRDMIRVDVRGDPTGLYYIEVNANPGKNRFSYLTTSAYYLGLEYAEVIAHIPYQAILKYRLRPPRKLRQLVGPVMALFDARQSLDRPRSPGARTGDRSAKARGADGKRGNDAALAGWGYVNRCTQC